MATLKLVRNDKPRKNSRIAVFDIEGRKTSVAIPKSMFVDGVVPESLDLNAAGEFAPVPTPRVPETPEERKARLAALPKLTLAEKIERREKQIAAMKAKLAASQAAPTGDQPQS